MTKDMLHTSSKTPRCATEQLQVSCQYCCSAGHQSNTCTWLEICPTCKAENHSLLHISLLLRSTKGLGKDYNGYKSNDPALGYLKIYHGIEGKIGNSQVSPVIILSAPVMAWPDHSCPEDVYCDNGFPRSRSTPGNL